MKSISVQYQELKEGKMNRHQFLRNARMIESPAEIGRAFV